MPTNDAVTADDAARKKRDEDKLLNHFEILRIIGDHQNILRMLPPTILTSTASATAEPKDQFTGNTLVQHLKSAASNNTNESLCRIMQGVAKALAFLHQHKIVYMDLKPDNIAITAEEEAKLMGFFSAHHVCNEKKDDGSKNPHPHSGAKRYTACEAMCCNPCTDASDVWSLACLMIWIISGNDPWHDQKFTTNTIKEFRNVLSKGKTPSIPTQFYNHETKQKLDTVHPALQLVMRLCLTKEHETRPTAKRVVELFGAILNELTTTPRDGAANKSAVLFGEIVNTLTATADDANSILHFKAANGNEKFQAVNQILQSGVRRIMELLLVIRYEKKNDIGAIEKLKTLTETLLTVVKNIGLLPFVLQNKDTTELKNTIEIKMDYLTAQIQRYCATLPPSRTAVAAPPTTFSFFSFYDDDDNTPPHEEGNSPTHSAP
ncbi:MAG: hypothetical protein ACD_42C00322G0004 [uncultured bacterium]|nr:MAG: hypothetical protein ACD_42C00322G0004 [uncultured bacterium]OGT32695.1 MAG: hypothetical protein A3C44_00245 [Gammaproteobacteria bacterium RIFCSPHIGHO2_02_FULL_39_13]OGT48659.1 MAG: hypothetical protein A3E53_05215 [Gammaproteobacteria bacterium RIFCSPHIGHO2_12_FULL_39_24]